MRACACVCDYSSAEMLEMYPNKFLQFDDHRIYIMNTLFDVPRESGRFACELTSSQCIVGNFCSRHNVVENGREMNYLTKRLTN